jgi:hypothetical protein
LKGFGLTEVDIKVLEDTDWNEQRGTATRQGITRIFACCGKILKEKRELSDQTTVLTFFK